MGHTQAGQTAISLSSLPQPGDGRVAEANRAPRECRYIVRAISGQGDNRAQRWSYLDASGNPLSRRTEPLPPYDPRNRDWYHLASGDERPHLGKAYVFNSLKEPGITASRSFGAGVFGIDMTLADLKGFLNEASPSKRGGILLLEDGHRLLAASDRASDWLPAGVQALGDVGPSPAITANADWMDKGGQVWLRQRNDWEWGADTRMTLIVMAPLIGLHGLFRLDTVNAGTPCPGGSSRRGADSAMDLASTFKAAFDHIAGRRAGERHGLQRAFCPGILDRRDRPLKRGLLPDEGRDRGE